MLSALTLGPPQGHLLAPADVVCGLRSEHHLDLCAHPAGLIREPFQPILERRLGLFRLLVDLILDSLEPDPDSPCGRPGFPRARIIYCSRDPRDISLSCFFQLFVEGAQHFSYDLTECAKRCRNVERMARHWMKLLPHHMIEVNYESLVGDLEGQSRRLIDFLGLEWEPACLDFHQTERTVATVSHWQVRQPIYSSSVGRWREYEKHLGGVFAALEDPATSDTAEAATLGLSA